MTCTKSMDNKKILDAACGSKMFWFNKNHPNALYMDNREVSTTLCDGRKLEIKPDLVADFTDIPFPDNTFYLVVFDPPHLLRAGENSWLRQKYGVLPEDWPWLIRNGFEECIRVLKPNGTLIFKWNEDQIKQRDVLEVIGQRPLFGNKRAKTHWMVFMKGENHDTKRVPRTRSKDLSG